MIAHLSDLSNVPTADLTQELLRRTTRKPRKGASIAGDLECWQAAIRLVCDAFGVHPTELLGRRRHATVATARHVLAYVGIQRGYNLCDIGRNIRLPHDRARDHSTIINSRIKTERSMENSPELAATVAAILARLDRKEDDDE
eukprot:GHVR01065590.1.p3 GENE.GHVR01065590.1~~GHVR01065590.1.p3  ORF type:complete len:143 (-),score=33.01 GHVR01065590.1:216-644(-)